MSRGLEDILRLESGWLGYFTREQAPGAMVNGTRVVKQGSKPGDGNPDGTPGVVLGSLQHDGQTLYFVEWASHRRCAVAVSAPRLREAAI